MASGQLLARLLDPDVGDATAFARGAGAGNALYKITQGREADALTPAAMRGDRNALAKLSGVDFERASTLDNRTYQRGRDARTDARADRADARTQETFDREAAEAKSRKIASVIYGADTPEKFEAAKGFLQSQGIPTDQLTFENRQSYIDTTLDVADRIKRGDDLAKAAAAARVPLSPEAKLEDDFKSGRMSREAYNAAIARKNAPGIEIGPDGKLRASPGIPLGKTPGNKVTTEIVNDTLLLDKTNRINDLVDDRFLQYLPQMGAMITRFKDKAGGALGLPTPSKEDAEFLAKKTRFDTTVEQLFNAYRKEITGAAAAVAELDRLKKSFLNKDMSPIEFRAALDEYQGALKRVLRLKKSLLRQGIDPETDEGGDVFDRKFLAGADDDLDLRYNEVLSENPGATDEEIFAILDAEGYDPDAR